MRKRVEKSEAIWLYLIPFRRTGAVSYGGP